MTKPIVTVFDGPAIDELLSQNKGALLECADESAKADRTGLLDLGTEYLFAEEEPDFLAAVLARVGDWLMVSIIMTFGIGSGVLWNVYSTPVWEILRRWQYWIWTQWRLWLL
jgi:hypothetical protein